jgi:hypothetical protein
VFQCLHHLDGRWSVRGQIQAVDGSANGLQFGEARTEFGNGSAALCINGGNVC